MKRLSDQPSFRCGRHFLIAGLFSIGLMAFFAIGVSTAQAQDYFVKDMGLLPEAKTCDPAALNIQGQVVGTAMAGEYGYAFRYYYNGNEGEMERVGLLGSRAFAIGPSGIIVGDAFVEKPGWVSHAVLFKGSEAVDLGTLKGYLFSRANAINALQQVVGFAGPGRDSSQSRAFIWTPTTNIIDMGTLGGDYAQAYAINDAGWVTGMSQIPDMGPRERATHAFIFQPLSPTPGHMQPMRDLGTLGGRTSCGMAINAMNHVAGYSTIDGTDKINHAFFYDGKTMIDLGVLEAGSLPYQSMALATNNSDQVVGFNYVKIDNTDQFNQVAFVWNRSTGMVNLNSLIAGWSDRYYLIAATALNDHGQIAVRAYDYQEGIVKAVLLTSTK